MNIRTKIYIIFIISGAVLIFRGRENVADFAKSIYAKNPVIHAVFAEDEEDEEDEDEDEDDRGAQVIDTSPSKSSTRRKTQTVTTYVKLSDRVSRQTETTTKYDSDGDGVFDEEDQNPTINEAYIVKDDNLNGIVDSYE